MTQESQDPMDLPQVVAGAGMIGRLGAQEFQIRYDDSEHPVVWMAIAGFRKGSPAQSVPTTPIYEHWESAAAQHPAQAVFRLLEILIDGGTCVHCQKPTAFQTMQTDPFPMKTGLDALICWYEYDPELETIRRGCEGD